MYFHLQHHKHQAWQDFVLKKSLASVRDLFPHDKVTRLKSPPLASVTLLKYIPDQMNRLYEVHDINLFLVYNVHLHCRKTLRLNASSHCNP